MSYELPPESRKFILQIKKKISHLFDENNWCELGVLTECSEIISSHSRLLRSLRFEDPDYEAHVTSVVSDIIKKDPLNIQIVEGYINENFTEYVNVSSSTTDRPKYALQPQVFNLPDRPIELDLVALMMPFSRNFNDVHQTISRACSDCSLRAQRVDDLWEHTTVIQDVFSLIFRSNIVICDFTGRNPNVFYEAGIAHTLGKHVVPITQSNDDVPFDIRHHRFLHYLNNQEGRQSLSKSLCERLNYLKNNSP